MKHAYEVVEINGQQIAVVPYTYMTAEQVDALKEQVKREAAWQTMLWGNLGPDGKSPLEVKPIAECNTGHLEAILITQPQLTPEQKATILELLKKRYFASTDYEECYGTR